MKPDFGKWLFPRLSPDQRRRQVHVLLAAALVGLVVAIAIAVVMYEVDKWRLY